MSAVFWLGAAQCVVTAIWLFFTIRIERHRRWFDRVDAENAAVVAQRLAERAAQSAGAPSATTTPGSSCGKSRTYPTGEPR